MIVEACPSWPTDDYVSMTGIGSPHWRRTDETVRVGDALPSNDDMRSIATAALLAHGLIVSGNGKFASRNLVIGGNVYSRKRMYTLARPDRDGVKDAAAEMAKAVAEKNGPGRIYAIDPTFIYLRKHDTPEGCIRLVRKCFRQDCCEQAENGGPCRFEGEPRVLLGCYYAHAPAERS